MQILIAEDNKLNQKILSYILQKKGFEITMATNGNDVIKLLRQQRFDVILMDIHMPDLGGYDTTAYIRTEMKNNIPIIAITADLVADEHEEYLKAGMNAFIAKPVSADELCKLIYELTKKQYANC